MKTREEIKTEIKQINSSLGELKNQLYKLDQVDAKELLQTYQYLVGECFIDNDSENNYYKIISIPQLFGAGVLCETILCKNNYISVSQHIHYPANSDEENGKITKEDFDSILNHIYESILNKMK